MLCGNLYAQVHILMKYTKKLYLGVTSFELNILHGSIKFFKLYLRLVGKVAFNMNASKNHFRSMEWSVQNLANIPQKNEAMDMVILLKKSLIENFFFSQWKLPPITVSDKDKGHFLTAASLLLFSCPIQTWDYCGEYSFINPTLITFSIWFLTQRLRGTS